MLFMLLYSTYVQKSVSNWYNLYREVTFSFKKVGDSDPCISLMLQNFNISLERIIIEKCFDFDV